MRLSARISPQSLRRSRRVQIVPNSFVNVCKSMKRTGCGWKPTPLGHKRDAGNETAEVKRLKTGLAKARSERKVNSEQLPYTLALPMGGVQVVGGTTRCEVPPPQGVKPTKRHCFYFSAGKPCICDPCPFKHVGRRWKGISPRMKQKIMLSVEVAKCNYLGTPKQLRPEYDRH